MATKLTRMIAFLLVFVSLAPTEIGSRNVGRKKGRKLPASIVQQLDQAPDAACIVEVAFILDSSESTKDTLFDQEKQFVIEFTERALLSEQSKKLNLFWRMAVLQYSSSVKMDHTFRDWQGFDQFKNRVQSMDHIGHGTYTSYAIGNATQLFQAEARQNSVKIVILMTDGVDHPRNPNLQNVATHAKEYGIFLFCLGPPHISSDLSAVASLPSSQFVHSLRDTNLTRNLLHEVLKVTKESCPKPKPCTCEKGERGKDGAPGRRGDQGQDGSPGEKGVQGLRGLKGETGIFGEKGKPGFKGHKGSKGECGISGTKGESGPKGSPGPTGKRGSQGLAGPAGEQGPEGIQGPKGDRGLTGLDGPIGNPGIGYPGPQGVKGSHGQPGPLGPPGIGESGLPGQRGDPGAKGGKGQTGQGAPGIKGDIGFSGPKGSRGTPGTGIKGAKGDIGHHGPSGPKGNAGIGLQGVKGDQGFKGPPGPRGPRGEGLIGEKGDRGFPGEMGQRGIGQSGPPGPKGDPGVPGTAGTSGIPGDFGSNGDKGEQGNPGLPGPPGIGIKGDPGQQGNPGKRGPGGFLGHPGSVGPAGPKGEPGLRGEVGLPGPSGKGFVGPKGDRGLPGPQGSIGDPGVGLTGPKGRHGDPGFPGPAGPKGEGYPGPQGVTGPHGPRGDPGDDGKGFPGQKGDIGHPGPLGPVGNSGIGYPGQKVNIDFKNIDFTQQQLPGTPGSPGLMGPRGPAGEGISGQKGNRGYTGERGSKGNKGDEGIPGIDGSSGTKGEKGEPGFTREEVIKLIRMICGCGRKCKEKPLELVFVMDSSESVGPEHFEIIKVFVSSLIERVSGSNEAARVGAILYSLKADIIIDLWQRISPEEAKTSIQDMQYLGEGTYTGTAIKVANQVFKLARKDARKVAIVITDGQTDTRDPTNLEMAVTEAHSVNTEVFVIGIANVTDLFYSNFKKEMNLIASDPDETHVYLIDDFRTLPTLESNLFSKICEPENDSLFSVIPSSILPPGVSPAINPVHRAPDRDIVHTDNVHKEGIQTKERGSPGISANKIESNGVSEDVSVTQNGSLPLPIPQENGPMGRPEAGPAPVDQDVWGKSNPFKDNIVLPTPAAMLIEENYKDPDCDEPLDQGSCRSYVIKWYYDSAANSCAQFWYGGCGGNQNRFQSQDECQNKCLHF
ncbi:collagen, type XXVIII, alpha 1a [Leucoraja erinacea]|uniref:collagen, type XXVIII, alpha 1a n=1 Tax=Leucoraja erinaceus TaxID=7782 RepID=UPI0024588F96|nr:collagen, type XXVIII, alpha 1a [Leucoraja erinacea]